MKLQDPGETHFRRTAAHEPSGRKSRPSAPTAAAIRLRRCGTPAGKSSALPTPLLKWKFTDRDGDGEDSVSARNLAAVLWRLRPSVSGAHRNSKGRDGKRRALDRQGFEAKGISSVRESPIEGATKWDHKCQSSSKELHDLNRHVKALDYQHISVSAVSALQDELAKAQIRIHELETDQESFQNKLEQFLLNLLKEKSSWQRREHMKTRVVVDHLKSELNRERKIVQRMQTVNSKLVHELAEARLSAKQCMRGYEKERESRLLIEEVCNELAKEIADDKTKAEALKIESIKIHEEVEEERKMLQMAEVWREERVQMKLVDAKITLEEKYSQMTELIAGLEDFLQTRASDEMDLKKPELIQQAEVLVNSHEANEISYVAPNSYDIFSIVRELQNEEQQINENEPRVESSSPDSASELCLGNPPDVISSGQPYSLGSVTHESVADKEANGLKPANRDESRHSAYFPVGSINKIEEDENGGRYSQSSEVSEVCSVSASSNKNASFKFKATKSFLGNRVNQAISAEAERRLSNGTDSIVEDVSPDRNSIEGEINIDQVTSCLDRSYMVPKDTLKAKLWEARFEAQKFQLRHVLEQRS